MYPSNTLHVYPLHDEKEHCIELEECWCDPDVQYLDPDTNLPWANGYVLVIHSSLDCRELIEQAESIKNYGIGPTNETGALGELGEPGQPL